MGVGEPVSTQKGLWWSREASLPAQVPVLPGRAGRGQLQCPCLGEGAQESAKEEESAPGGATLSVSAPRGAWSGGGLEVFGHGPLTMRGRWLSGKILSLGHPCGSFA